MTVEKTAAQIYELLSAELAATEACQGVRVVAISRINSVAKEGNWDATFGDGHGKRPGEMAERAAIAAKARLQRKFHIMDRPP